MTENSAPGAPGDAVRLGPRMLILLISSLVAVGALAIDLYIPSFPAMAADLAADPTRVELTMGAFLMGYALSQLVYGPLSDRFGRRHVLLLGMVIFVLSSFACAFAPDVDTLIALRFLQAFGACAGPAVGRALVRDLYELEQAARVFAYIAMVMIIVPILAPLLGAWFEILFGWRAHFAFMTLAGMLLLAASYACLGETNRFRDPTATRPAQMARNYFELLSNARFMGYSLSIAFAFAGVFAFVTASSFVLIELLALDPRVYALLFGLTAMGYAAGSYLSSRLIPRIGFDATIFLGGAIFLVSAVVMHGLAVGGIFNATAICVPMTALSIGNGMMIPNCQAGAIAPFPRMAGAAAAMMGFMSMGGAGIGGALVARFHDGTQLPMTFASLIGGIGMVMVFYGLVWRRRAAVAAAGS